MRVSVAALVRLPDTPVMVTVNGPRVAVALAVKVIWLTLA